MLVMKNSKPLLQVTIAPLHHLMRFEVMVLRNVHYYSTNDIKKNEQNELLKDSKTLL